jgi:hypothetical protein
MRRGVILLPLLLWGLCVEISAQARWRQRPARQHHYIDARTKRAVKKGLAFLARKQNGNGSWNCKIGEKLNEDYIGKDGQHVGTTALAGMAFLAGGHTPGRGKYGSNVARALDFILSCADPDTGYISKHGTRMYSHAFATMFLAEVYGMSDRKDLRTKLKRAVQLIINSQYKNGGWRYQPFPRDADISVTVSTLQALRAARNAGISVSSRVIKKAMRYIKKSATRNGYAYQLPEGKYSQYHTRHTFPLTACGVVSLYSAGIYKSKELRWGLRFLQRTRSTLIWGRYHYFYGHYYAVQAMYQAGGRYWARYFPRVRDEIISHQRDDGGWVDDVGRNYATAMACLILQVPYNYLPIFQK